jgi:hypothetical protein
MRRRSLCIALGLALFSCHGGRLRSAGGASERIAPGERCDPKGRLGPILDGDLKPVDLKDEFSVEAAAGRPVLVCVQISEDLSGRVVDESTRAPLAGAKITVNSWQSPTPVDGLHEPRSMIHSQQVLTDTQGKWRLASVSLWMGGFLAADGIPFVKSSQCIQAAGYAPAVFDPWKRPDWATNPDLSEVKLAPAGKRVLGLSSACVFDR